MLRLSLTADTSPLWGAVPSWEAGVDGLIFRDVPKESALCSLAVVGALQACAWRRHAPPGAGGTAVGPAARGRGAIVCGPLARGRLAVSAGTLPLLPPCGPLADGDWLTNHHRLRRALHRGPLVDGDWLGRSWPRPGRPGGEASGLMGPSIQGVDSDAGAEGLPEPEGFPGRGAAKEVCGPAGGRVCDQWLPSPAAMDRRGGVEGRAGGFCRSLNLGGGLLGRDPSRFPVGALAGGGGLPTSTPLRLWRASLPGLKCPDIRTASVRRERLQGAPTTLTIPYTAQGGAP